MSRAWSVVTPAIPSSRSASAAGPAPSGTAGAIRSATLRSVLVITGVVGIGAGFPERRSCAPIRRAATTCAVGPSIGGKPGVEARRDCPAGLAVEQAGPDDEVGQGRGGAHPDAVERERALRRGSLRLD